MGPGARGSVRRPGLGLVILNSAEYRTSVVTSYYRQLLGRPTAPSAVEVDSWVFAMPWLDLAMIRTGFESSAEFFVNG